MPTVDIWVLERCMDSDAQG